MARGGLFRGQQNEAVRENKVLTNTGFGETPTLHFLDTDFDDMWDGVGGWGESILALQ